MVNKKESNLNVNYLFRGCTTPDKLKESHKTTPAISLRGYFSQPREGNNLYTRQQ